MRILILSILFIICAQEAFTANPHLQATSIGAHQPTKKATYSKGKGVLGLITGLVLGPVGYAGVCIFSHNRITRKKALLGMEIWGGLVFSVLLILLVLKNGGFKGLGKGSGSKGSSNFVPNINLGNNGNSDPKSQKPKRVISTNAVIVKP